jgi:hypothetical protein
MKGTTFTNSSLVAVDFMSTNLTRPYLATVIYIVLNLKAIADKADFRTSATIQLIPQNKLKSSIFY